MKFRKKPVVIEAYEFQNKAGQVERRPEWLLDAVGAGTVAFKLRRNAPGYLTIQTLEGEMTAELGDWIIRGIKGELYPIKDEIFRESYEAVV